MYMFSLLFTFQDAPDGFNDDDRDSGLVIKGDTVAWLLRRFADAAEKYERLNDEL